MSEAEFSKKISLIDLWIIHGIDAFVQSSQTKDGSSTKPSGCFVNISASKSPSKDAVFDIHLMYLEIKFVGNN